MTYEDVVLLIVVGCFTFIIGYCISNVRADKEKIDILYEAYNRGRLDGFRDYQSKLVGSLRREDKAE